MEYLKPALTFEQQAERLIGRGLDDPRDELIDRLKAVSYYRLSGYLHPFLRADDTYRPGTRLDAIWRRYTFDRRLRLLVMDPIERIEVNVRTALVYELAHSSGAFGYTRAHNLPGLDAQRFGKFMVKLGDAVHQSHERFVKHFQAKYGDRHSYLPVWMAAELWTFGMTLTVYRGVDKAIQKRIADRFGIPHDVLFSWLNALNAVRNICAHHGRLWNRELGVKPKIPHKNKHPRFHTPFPISANRIFGIVTICKDSLDAVASQSHWPDRLRALIAEYPDIPLNEMGFPDRWQDSAIWCVVR